MNDPHVPADTTPDAIVLSHVADRRCLSWFTLTMPLSAPERIICIVSEERKICISFDRTSNMAAQPGCLPLAWTKARRDLSLGDVPARQLVVSRSLGLTYSA